MSKRSGISYICLYNYNLTRGGVDVRLRALLFYLLFLKFTFSAPANVVFSFSFKKLRNNIIVINRAPYRFKLSRHQFFFSRFCLTFSFRFKLLFKTKNYRLLLSRLSYLFCSSDFCFFSVFIFKLSVQLSLKEWLR